jgi:hypothetical protein
MKGGTLTALRSPKTMNTRKLMLLFLLGFVFASASQAQIKHIEMRVEGMT